MKKLHSLAFYALVAPAITLGSGAVLAAQASSENEDLGEQSMGQDADREKQSSQQNQDAMESSNKTAQSDQSGMKNQSYLGSAPPNGMQASDLIGTDLKTSGDESVGEIGDLIIDQDGKVMAVVVSVGGFLGMGEKHVAISWDKVQTSSNADDRDLRVDVTRDELESAPGFEKQDN
ncbi:PRC-barrel domain containing protein [Marinobacter panjinensis]|uniref:PRC-barrel domain containing protein n=1 Tax=Marinobacter panjinensis TaxID=2576384 RepID=A0A4U6R113_9GAMM|nr:PRC-barrel domain-containing protein [Marinobacter panjinensis]MCR8914068.1 PRC-barrel domain-containing protein [Marinobacter panjinensis]TKV67307.1 PRC-barrel domain containing protein [Marinobacter panjinensis]